MMNTHNATNADLGAALDDGSSMVQTGGTLGSTNLAYHSPPANIGIVAHCPGGWWFYSPGVGPEYFAVKDRTGDTRTTILDPTRQDMIRVLIRDFKLNHPTPSPAIEDIGAVLATAIKAAAAPVVNPAEMWMKEMCEKMAAQQQAMLQQIMAVQPIAPPEVVAVVAPRPEQQLVARPTAPPPPPAAAGGRVGWPEVSIVLITILGLCFVSYLLITKPEAASTALMVSPPVNHRYRRYEEEDSYGSRFHDHRAAVKQEETVVPPPPPADIAEPASPSSMSWWKIAAITLACVFLCNCFAGASRSYQADYDHYYEPRLVEDYYQQ